jgi:CcmD family protein
MAILITAYIIVWLAIFLYVAWLHVEQRRLTRCLETLKSRIEKELD